MARCKSYEECINLNKKEECDLGYVGCAKGAPEVIGEVEKVINRLTPFLNDELRELNYCIEGWSAEKIGGEGTPFEEQWTLNICISPEL